MYFLSELVSVLSFLIFGRPAQTQRSSPSRTVVDVSLEDPILSGVFSLPLECSDVLPSTHLKTRLLDTSQNSLSTSVYVNEFVYSQPKETDRYFCYYLLLNRQSFYVLLKTNITEKDSCIKERSSHRLIPQTSRLQRQTQVPTKRKTKRVR